MSRDHIMIMEWVLLLQVMLNSVLSVEILWKQESLLRTSWCLMGKKWDKDFGFLRSTNNLSRWNPSHRFTSRFFGSFHPFNILFILSASVMYSSPLSSCYVYIISRGSGKPRKVVVRKEWRARVRRKNKAYKNEWSSLISRWRRREGNMKVEFKMNGAWMDYEGRGEGNRKGGRWNLRWR